MMRRSAKRNRGGRGGADAASLRAGAALEERHWIVNAWRETVGLSKLHGGDARRATRAFLAMLADGGRRISGSTLYNWSRAYAADGLKGLRDQRRYRERAKDFSLFLAELCRLYVGPGLYPIKTCFWRAQDTAAARGWNVPTLRRAQAYIRGDVLPELTKERGCFAED